MYVFITLLVSFLVLFSSACLYMTVCIDLCDLTPPVCGLSFISIKFCSVLQLLWRPIHFPGHGSSFKKGSSNIERIWPREQLISHRGANSSIK